MDSRGPHRTFRIWPTTLVGRLGLSLVALIVGATAIASFLDYRRDRVLATERAQAELQVQAELVAERLRQEIQDRRRAVDLWPELEAAQDLAVDDLDRRLSASLLQLSSSFGPGDQALGISPNGTVLAASDAALIGSSLAGSPFLAHLDSLLAEAAQADATSAEVALLPDGRRVGLPPLDPEDPGAHLLAFSQPVVARAGGRPLGWIVLLSAWPDLVRASARDLGASLLISGPTRSWYEGDSLRGREGPWVEAGRALGTVLPEPMEVILRVPLTAVLAPLQGAGIRVAGLAGLFLLAVVPPSSSSCGLPFASWSG